MLYAVSASFQKSYHVEYILEPNCLCIMQFRMQSPEWLNITVKSTIYHGSHDYNVEYFY